MGPIPAFEIRVHIRVQEPDPSGGPCPTVLEPYKQRIDLGPLRFGRYVVNAVEYLVPFSPDSSAAPLDSSLLSASFDVAAADCPPGLGCYMLSFGRASLAGPPRPPYCDASAGPGGTACVDVWLHNGSPVGGVQTEVVVYQPDGNRPIASGYLTPLSVEAVGRAAGFRVAWTADGPRAKILLFSPSGDSLPPGEGAVLRVCHTVSADAPDGRYTLRHENIAVVDPNGITMMPCPTFAEIVGTICVAKGGCDLNGDSVSNIQDIVLLVQCALAYPNGGTAVCPDSVAAKADCNLDGKLDIGDVICCVRRILDDGGSFGSGTGSVGPWASGITRIGFADPPRWDDRSTGHVSVEVGPGVGFGGIQFAIDQAGAARIRDLALTTGSGSYAMEWADAGSSIRVMIYRSGAPPSGVPSGAPGVLIPPIRVDATIEPVPGATGATTFSLNGVAAATTTGEVVGTSVESGTVSIAANPVAAPAVSAPAPNPFASETSIAYTLSAATRVTIRIYDVTGRLVRTLTDATVPAGPHSATWDGRDRSGRDLGSGIYFFKFAAGSVEKTNRLLKLR